MKKERPYYKQLQLMMINQITRKKMNMDNQEFIAGYCFKKETERYQKHSSLSQLLVENTQ